MSLHIALFIFAYADVAIYIRFRVYVIRYIIRFNNKFLDCWLKFYQIMTVGVSNGSNGALTDDSISTNGQMTTPTAGTGSVAEENQGASPLGEDGAGLTADQSAQRVSRLLFGLCDVYDPCYSYGPNFWEVNWEISFVKICLILVMVWLTFIIMAFVINRRLTLF